MFFKTSLLLCMFFFLIAKTRQEIKTHYVTELYCGTGESSGSTTYCGDHGECVVNTGCRSVYSCYNSAGSTCSEYSFSGFCQSTNVIQDLSKPCCGTKCCCDEGWSGPACDMLSIIVLSLVNCTTTLNETITEGIQIIETLEGKRVFWLWFWIGTMILLGICVLGGIVLALCWAFNRPVASTKTNSKARKGKKVLLKNQFR